MENTERTELTVMLEMRDALTKAQTYNEILADINAMYKKCELLRDEAIDKHKELEQEYEQLNK